MTSALHMAAGALLALASLAHGQGFPVARIVGSATEQWAAYNVCKGMTGDLSYCYRESDGTMLIRCPVRLVPPPIPSEFCKDLRLPEPRIEIPRCKGTLAFDASYNVVVICPDGRKIPIIRGPYPR